MKIDERIVFFGRNKNYNITLLCFKKLLNFTKNSNHSIICTVCSDDSHNEKGTLEELIKKSDIPLYYIKKNDVNKTEFINNLKKLEPTIFVTVQFPKIFSSELLSIPTRGSYNIHRGWPLRGGAIDERAIYFQQSDYSLILHRMDPGIDTGSIIGKITIKIGKKEDGFTLVTKADKAGEQLFEKSFIPLIGNKIPKGDKQNLKNTIYGSKDSLSNKIDFKKSANEIERLSRAFYHPRKIGIELKSKRIHVFLIPQVEIIDEKSIKKPGTIISLKDDCVRICVKDKIISIKNCHTGNKKSEKFGRLLIKKAYKVGDTLDE